MLSYIYLKSIKNNGKEEMPSDLAKTFGDKKVNVLTEYVTYGVESVKLASVFANVFSKNAVSTRGVVTSDVVKEVVNIVDKEFPRDRVCVDFAGLLQDLIENDNGNFIYVIEIE